MNDYEITKCLKDIYISLKYNERYFVDKNDKETLFDAVQLIEQQAEIIRELEKELELKK